MTISIKTKHKNTKPNQWLSDLRAVENQDGKMELRTGSNYLVKLSKLGPHAEFYGQSDSFGLWITEAQYQACLAILENASPSL